MNRKIYVAQSYNVSLDRIRPSTPELLLRSAIKDYSQGKSNLRAEFINAKATPISRCDCETEETTCKFFFDYDKTYEGDRVDDQTLEQDKADLVDVIKDIMEVRVGAERDSFTIHSAQRHGQLADNRFKTSFRFFVSGYRTTPYSIKNALINGGITSFDLSVYSRNRRLCMVLGNKTKTDQRKLMPTEQDIQTYRDNTGTDKDPLTELDFMKNYLALYVEDDWPVMDVDLDRDEANDNRQDDDEEGEERPARARRTIPQTASFETIRDLLHVSGFSNPRQVHPSREEGDKVHVAFDCDARDDCPLCHKQHDHQNWLAAIDTKAGVAVRNLSERCLMLPLMSPYFLHEHIRRIMECEFHHSLAATWYLNSRQHTLRYHQGTGTFHEFKDQRWTSIPDELICDSIRVYMTHQLLGSQLQRVKKWEEVGKQLQLQERVIKMIKKTKKTLLGTMNTAGAQAFPSAVLKVTRGMCFTDNLMFDRNHELLHFSNGVLNLDTKEFREARPSDFNTLTTGYEYEPLLSQEALDFHRDFINKIYPDPVVREVAQRVLGSTLSGYNHAKKLFIFTDNGGETGGNNGKTQMFRLHQMALGDYAVVPKKEFLYDGQVNAEAASPNMAKLRAKRAVIVEELEPQKKLAEGLVKEMTNGTNPIFMVRDLYKSASPMEICTKVMIGCNHGKFPRFDPYDEALTNRFLPVPHISHFTTDSSKWDPVRHIYPANADVAEKMNDPEHRMAHMLWCLEGYDNYKRLQGFGTDTLPNRILDFKRVFIFKNTPVYAYLGEVLEETDHPERDMLGMGTVWDMYKKDRRSNKYLTMEQFEASFRVFVNSAVPNSFQYQRMGNASVPFARGFKIRPDVGDSLSRPRNFDADTFL